MQIENWDVTLNFCWKQTPIGRREQSLVRWSDPAILDATWEDAV